MVPRRLRRSTPGCFSSASRWIGNSATIRRCIYHSFRQAPSSQVACSCWRAVEDQARVRTRPDVEQPDARLKRGSFDRAPDAALEQRVPVVEQFVQHVTGRVPAAAWKGDRGRDEPREAAPVPCCGPRFHEKERAASLGEGPIRERESFSAARSNDSRTVPARRAYLVWYKSSDRWFAILADTIARAIRVPVQAARTEYPSGYTVSLQSRVPRSREPASLTRRSLRLRWRATRRDRVRTRRPSASSGARRSWRRPW